MMLVLKLMIEELLIQILHLPPEKPAGKTFDAMDEANQASVVAEVVGLLRNEAKVKI